MVFVWKSIDSIKRDVFPNICFLYAMQWFKTCRLQAADRTNLTSECNLLVFSCTCILWKKVIDVDSEEVCFSDSGSECEVWPRFKRRWNGWLIIWSLMKFLGHIIEWRGRSMCQYCRSRMLCADFDFILKLRVVVWQRMASNSDKPIVHRMLFFRVIWITAGNSACSTSLRDWMLKWLFLHLRVGYPNTPPGNLYIF